MLTLDPIPMTSERTAAEYAAQREEDERIRRRALEMMAEGGLSAPDAPPAPEGGMRVLPPGTEPAPNAATAARGAEDIFGTDPFGQTAAPATPGVGRALSAPSAREPGAMAPSPPPSSAGTVPAHPSTGAVPAETTPDAKARVAAALAARSGRGKGAAPEPYDYTGEDIADAIARPFRALGAGLQAAAGRTPTRRPTFREQAEARNARAQAQDMAQQRQAQAGDLALARLGAQAARLAQADEGLRIRQASLGLAQERETRLADDASRRAANASRLAQGRLRSMRLQSEREAAVDDPESEVSRLSRVALGAALAGYPPEARLRLQEQLGVDDLDAHLSTLSMRASDQLRQSLPSMFRDLTNRRGRGTGAGGGGSAQSAESVQALARRSGMSEEEIAAFGTSRRDREALRTEALRRGRAGRDAGTVIPGWQFGESGDPGLSAPEVTRLRDTNAQANILQGQIRTMLSLIDEVGTLEAAGAEQGVVSERMGRVRGAHEQIINALRNVGNYGVPQEAELTRMESLAPRLGSVAGVLSARNMYSGLSSSMRQRMDDYMGSYNLSRAEGGGGQARAQVAPAVAGRRRVRLPSGRMTQPLTADQVRQVLERFPGAEVR